MLNITIDGFAGAGKSHLAKELAKNLNIHHFNTGLVYRALACEFMVKYGENCPIIQDLNGSSCPSVIKEFVKGISIDVKFADGKQYCVINKHVFDEETLRHEKTSAFTPKISPYFQIRDVVRRIQRGFARENDCVMEGRDIGRVVLPNATYKFFLTASAEERANRRFKQLGGVAKYEEILAGIQKRDYEDVNRKEGALIPAKNSIIVDTTNMNLEEVIKFCLEKINKNSHVKL